MLYLCKELLYFVNNYFSKAIQPLVWLTMLSDSYISEIVLYIFVKKRFFYRVVKECSKQNISCIRLTTERLFTFHSWSTFVFLEKKSTKSTRNHSLDRWQYYKFRVCHLKISLKRHIQLLTRTQYPLQKAIVPFRIMARYCWICTIIVE